MTDKFIDKLNENNLYYTFDKSRNMYTIKIPVNVDKNDLARFKCPLCVEQYKVNGNEYKNSKNLYHTHGWCEGGIRSRHCRSEAIKYYGCINWEFLLEKREQIKPLRCEKCRYLDRTDFIDRQYIDTLICSC